MLPATFCCPTSKEALTQTPTGLRCESSGRTYEIVNGIPDFFIAEGDYAIREDDRNRKWLDPQVVEGRNQYYRYCTRKLKGMAFCIEEIGKRTFPGCCILEAAAGTGHFTRWLTEVCKPDTEVYAFDYSWPILDKAIANTQGCSGITFFRANARGLLPFQEETFDIVLIRLAPFAPSGGAKGTSAERAFDQLKPGGWYFSAGFQEEWSTLEDLQEFGYKNVEHHRWQYDQIYENEEYLGLELESGRSIDEAQALLDKRKQEQNRTDGLEFIQKEHLIMAQKPER